MRPLLGSCPVLFVEVEHWYFSAGALLPPNVRQTLFSRSVPVNTPPYNLILWQLSENRETGIWRPCKISSHICKFFIRSQSVKALEWNFYSAAFHLLIFFFFSLLKSSRLHLFFSSVPTVWASPALFKKTTSDPRKHFSFASNDLKKLPSFQSF